MGEDPQVIKERTERAREELADDISTLSDKLNPKKQAAAKVDQVKGKGSEVVDKVKDKLHMGGSDSGSASSDSGITGRVGGTVSSLRTSGAARRGGDVLTVVRENPLAAAAVTLGAAKLASGFRRTGDRVNVYGEYGYPMTGAYGTVAQHSGTTAEWDDQSDGGGVRGRLEGATSSVKDQAGKVTGKLSGAKDSVAGTASNVQGSVSDKAQQAAGAVTERVPTSKFELENSVRSNVVAWGIGAAALGAIAGLVAPRTRLEDERLGEVKEMVVDQVQDKAALAKDAGQEALGQLKGTAREGLEQAKETAKDGLQQAKDTAQQSASSGGSSNPNATGIGSEASRRPEGLTGGTSPVGTPNGSSL